MTTATLLKLHHAPQGAAMAEALKEAFADEPSVTVEVGGPLPSDGTATIGLFLLTADAEGDPALASAVQAASAAGCPLLPVVPQLADYDFNALPEALGPLRAVDAAQWGADGAEAIQAARRLLGLELFRREARLFISYRRGDGGEVAAAIQHHLEGRGFNAFLDTRDMEAGQEVQRRIREEIAERDLLLLVNSPDAVNSPWVHKEVEEALARQVAVVVVSLHKERFPLLRHLPGLEWNRDDPEILRKVERKIIEVVALRRRFDHRVRDMVKQWCDLNGWRQRKIDPRRVRLIGPRSSSCLLEYEDAPHTVDRLYRLYLNHQDFDTTGAVFVHGGIPLSERERTAVEWAIHGEPLQVVALEELFTLLESRYATGADDGGPT